MRRAREWVPALPALLIVVPLAGCGGFDGAAPVKTYEQYARPRVGNTHIVSAGDTLYSIAWFYGIDYRDLAARNGIGDPYTIYPGQRLIVDTGARPEPEDQPHARLGAPARDLNAPRRPATQGSRANGRQPTAAADSASKTPSRQATTTRRSSKPSPRESSAAQRSTRVAKWAWPAKGKVVTSFSQSGKKGVNISGTDGAPITAAAGGRVVYAGGGLRGYGELIIVKHNKRFLSAYAHNKRILVKEGDEVKIGQRIAEMGSTGTDNVMLHFEIRRDGKPVDPVQYLPR